MVNKLVRERGMQKVKVQVVLGRIALKMVLVEP